MLSLLVPSVKPTLRELSGALSKVSADWFMLGIRLDLTANDLRTIEANRPHNVGQCMNDMLHKWQSKYPQQGWHDIVRSLREMDKNNIADDITEGSVTRQNHQRYLKFTQISVKFQISVQISEFQYLISINKYCQFLA